MFHVQYHAHNPADNLDRNLKHALSQTRTDWHPMPTRDQMYNNLRRFSKKPSLDYEDRSGLMLEGHQM